MKTKTKKQIVEEFLDKMKQRYRCLTRIYENKGDVDARVSYARSHGHIISISIECDDPKWQGYDRIDVYDGDEHVFAITASHINKILAKGEEEFISLAEGVSPTPRDN